MAADWLKVFHDTIDKPEIAMIAEAVGCSQEEAFGWWFRLYCYADGETSDGFMPGMTLRRLAALAHVPYAVVVGLSGQYGWLFESVEGKSIGVFFKNWERHNGQSSKKRSQDARRSENYRERKRQKPRAKTPRIVG